MDYGKPPVAVGSTGTLVAVGAGTTDLFMPFLIATVFGTVAMVLFRRYWRRNLTLGE